MTTLSIADACRMADVDRQRMEEMIGRGEISVSSAGIEISELIKVYPHLEPLANVKIREVKKSRAVSGRSGNRREKAFVASDISTDDSIPVLSSRVRQDDETLDSGANHSETNDTSLKSSQSGTVELLVRELEWNKELLEQTNQLMARQLEEQRALIADQARRLDEKDRFWARQIEIAQSLLPAPEPPRRKRFLGILLVAFTRPICC